MSSLVSSTGVDLEDEKVLLATIERTCGILNIGKNGNPKLKHFLDYPEDYGAPEDWEYPSSRDNLRRPLRNRIDKLKAKPHHPQYLIWLSKLGSIAPFEATMPTSTRSSRGTPSRNAAGTTPSRSNARSVPRRTPPRTPPLSSTRNASRPARREAVSEDDGAGYDSYAPTVLKKKRWRRKKSSRRRNRRLSLQFVPLE
jgi:hypothetical protein